MTGGPPARAAVLDEKDTAYNLPDAKNLDRKLSLESRRGEAEDRCIRLVGIFESILLLIGQF